MPGSLDDRLVDLLGSWRTDPVKFVREAFDPTPQPEVWQAEALADLATHDKIAIKSGHGVGKALHVDTRVLTPMGWVLMRDLRPGDEVIGANGKPTEVLGVYPQGERQLYEVLFDDNTRVLADEEHLWHTQTKLERERAAPGEVRTTKSIAETIDNQVDDSLFFKEPTYNWRELDLRPYGAGNKDVMKNYKIRKRHKALEAAQRGRAPRARWRHRLNHSVPTVMPLEGAHVETDVDPWDAGFDGDYEACAWFRFGTVTQRATVLRGWADNPDHRVSWQKRKPGMTQWPMRRMRDADDGFPQLLCDMIRSLGGWVHLPTMHPTDKTQGGSVMEVYNPPLVPIYSKDRFMNLRHVPRPQHIRSVTQAEVGPALCIKVAAEDGLFVLEGYKVTHNTTLLSWAVIWFSLTRQPFKIPCTAPAGATLNSALWPEIGKWRRQLHPTLAAMLNHTSARLELVGSNGGSFAEARTSRQDQPEALQGFHEDNLLFIVDEASGVPDIVFQVGEGSLSTEGAKIMLAGNPNRTTGYFWDAFNPRPGQRQRWKTRTVPSWESTRVSRDWLEDMKEKYGTHSPIYQIRVAGEFPETDDFVLIPRHVIEAAVRRGRDMERPQGKAIIWGVDVARQGNDQTAVAKRSGPALLEPVETWHGFDLMQSSGRVMRMYDDTPAAERPKEICIDVIGVGAGLYDRLKEQGLPVTPVNVSERAEDSGRYFNRRSELWFKTKDWLSQPETSIPEDPLLEAELGTPQYQIMSNGKEKVEPKEDTKKRLGEGGRSPDSADALVLTLAASSRWDRPGGLDVATMAPRTEHSYDPRRW